MSINLYFADLREVRVRYETLQGVIVERCATSPAALLLQPPDLQAKVERVCLKTIREIVHAAFRGMPLRPDLPWTFEPEQADPVAQKAFDFLLACLRQPPERRWCRRGEPGSFLQFGYRTEEGYALGAFVLPYGKPWVLTFRCEDCVRALPPAIDFQCMMIISAATGLQPAVNEAMSWDTRVKLPLGEMGAAWVTCQRQACPQACAILKEI